MTPHEAWAEIMRLAAEHAMIVAAAGGVATIALPEEQEKAGIRERCLHMAGKGPYPKDEGRGAE